MIKAVIVLACLGGVLGALLGFADSKLKIEVDSRIQGVLERLPGINCGGCGYPGCTAFADALIEGKVEKVSKCIVASDSMKKDIKEYLETSPGPTGDTITVKI